VSLLGREYLKIEQRKLMKNDRVIETDHNAMIAEFDLKVESQTERRCSILRIKVARKHLKMKQRTIQNS
jgi:hypothetical protein